MLSCHLSINVIIIVVSFKILDLCPIALFQQLWNALFLHILQNKSSSCTWIEMLNPVPDFSNHSIQSYATLPVAIANVSKSQLLYVCRWCWVYRTNVELIDQVKNNLS